MLEFNYKKTKYIVLLIISVIFLLFLVNEIRKDITGMLVASVDVSGTTAIRVSSFDYPVFPDLGEFVNVTIEVQNSGSTSYSENIEVFIKNSTMHQLAYYYDSSNYLNPGDRDSFKLVYLPPDYGVYFIQLRISYAETRRLETWGIFVVSEPTSSNITGGQTTVTIGQQETGAGYGAYVVSESDYLKGRAAPAEEPYLEHALKIECPDELEVLIGETTVTYIKLHNIGNSTLHNLRLYTYTQNIEVDVYPKLLISFPSNTSSIFMASIKVPRDIKPNLYSLDIEFSSNEIDAVKKMTLNATDLSLKDIVYRTIQNYKFILAELEGQILEASERGVDISNIQMRLEALKIEMGRIENHYEDGNYSIAYQKLKEIRPDIQSLLLDFALINVLRGRGFFRLSNWIMWILIILLILVAILIYLYLKSKRKPKRPKLLRESSEEKPE